MHLICNARCLARCSSTGQTWISCWNRLVAWEDSAHLAAHMREDEINPSACQARVHEAAVPAHLHKALAVQLTRSCLCRLRGAAAKRNKCPEGCVQLLVGANIPCALHKQACDCSITCTPCQDMRHMQCICLLRLFSRNPSISKLCSCCGCTGAARTHCSDQDCVSLGPNMFC